MTYNGFKKLSHNEQADCLWEKGKPVGSYKAADAKFVLYQLEGFYVEAEYKTDFMEIIALRAMQTENIPEIYLDQVNISGLNH